MDELIHAQLDCSDAGAVSRVRFGGIRLNHTGPARYCRGCPQEFVLSVVDDLGDVVDLCLEDLRVHFAPADVSYTVVITGPGTATVCYVVAASRRVEIRVCAGACTVLATKRAKWEVGAPFRLSPMSFLTGRNVDMAFTADGSRVTVMAIQPWADKEARWNFSTYCVRTGMALFEWTNYEDSFFKLAMTSTNTLLLLNLAGVKEVALEDGAYIGSILPRDSGYPHNVAAAFGTVVILYFEKRNLYTLQMLRQPPGEELWSAKVSGSRIHAVDISQDSSVIVTCAERVLIYVNGALHQTLPHPGLQPALLHRFVFCLDEGVNVLCGHADWLFSLQAPNENLVADRFHTEHEQPVRMRQLNGMLWFLCENRATISVLV